MLHKTGKYEYAQYLLFAPSGMPEQDIDSANEWLDSRAQEGYRLVCVSLLSSSRILYVMERPYLVETEGNANDAPA